ncbi:MAG TPA: hypothetical protein VF556_07790 [Pyrinomonadaceae bacterium]
MAENKPTKEQLERRRDEINKQLNEVHNDERIQLDNELEEQAIQLEQHDVSVTMEQNLRKELAIIEDQLLDLEEK